MSHYTPFVTVGLLSTLAILSACSPKSRATDMAAPTVNLSSPLTLAATTNSTDVANQTTKLSAPLAGSSEVPPVTSNGSGNVEATLDKSTNRLSWMVTYSALVGPTTASHFHGPADTGVNAGVVLPLTGSLASPIKGEATLTAAQAADLSAGKWYLNIHTGAHPDGEIRGQLKVQP